jgi:hypothetical protein
MKNNLMKEKAQVEAGVGTVKHPKYDFTKPDARSRLQPEQVRTRVGGAGEDGAGG